MPALGQRTPAHIRALDKTLIGEGCWEYGGKIGNHGYGLVYIPNGTRHGATALAHRVVYEGMVGPIPDGMFLCHHCDNPRCVRPDHLFLGTLNDNVQDAKQKGRMKTGGVLPPVRKGEANNKAKLTADKVREIRQEYQSGTSITKLGRRFGVTEQAIWAIVTRQTWKHVE
jgi:hypothetical protein